MTAKNKPESLFDRLKASLEEGLRHIRGEVELREYDIPAKPPVMKSAEIVDLRERLELSQATFSGLLNVSLSTLTLWEEGKRKPTGAAARLLQVYAERPDVVNSMTHGRNGETVKPHKRTKAPANV